MFGMQMGKMGGVGQMTLAQRIAYMFANSEPGAWYDPSDLPTLFQDTAGTTPVTAVEQAVALMLDKSGRGNHATQATSTKRPNYSRRVNVLLNTENPSAWPTIGITGTAEAGGVSLLQSTADSSQINPSSQYPIGWTPISNSCVYRSIEYLPGDALYLTYGPASGLSFVTIRTSDGVVVGAAGGASPLRKITPLSDGWVRVETWDSLASHGATELSSFLYFGNTFDGLYIATTGRAGTQIRVRRPQYVVLPFGSTHSVPYQWVNTDTDYDADPAKFPAYLRFDGVDDALQTGNIDFTGTDKMTVWAGVAKLSDAGIGIVSELSGSIGSNNGTFTLAAPANAGPTIQFASRGTVVVAATEGTIPSPASRVLCGYADIAGESCGLRINGVATVSPYSQGTGNYGNYPLYIGGRACTSAFFNGRLYSLIVRGAQSSLSQIEATENLIRQKMRLP